MTPADLAQQPAEPVPVSRDVERDLAAFGQILQRWNKAVNLVSASTLADLRRRHILDSVQLLHHAPETARHWVDLGSGGGFPGLVVAIAARASRPDLHVTLIDSDQRKAAFLGEAARSLGLDVSILCGRVEDAAPQNADIVSARALAPLPVLLGLAHRHLRQDGLCLFLKGAGADAEIAAAEKHWTFRCEGAQSQSDPAGRVLKIEGLRHVA